MYQVIYDKILFLDFLSKKNRLITRFKGTNILTLGVKSKFKVIMSLEIIPFEPRHSHIFRDLNVAWLKKYFYVEPKDIELLENCQKSIIDEGGYIFFAKNEDNIVGCFSFIPLNNTTYELGKMAVDPNFQGLKIGQKLLTFAIDFAIRHHWDKIVLYSSTKLDTALHIYSKYGFREAVLEKEVRYARSDIKMELELNNQI